MWCMHDGAQARSRSADLHVLITTYCDVCMVATLARIEPFRLWPTRTAKPLVYAVLAENEDGILRRSVDAYETICNCSRVFERV
jgi:hypothetical protein